MNELEKYFKLCNEIDKLNEQKELAKKKIIKQIQQSKTEKIEKGFYEAYVTYKKVMKWDQEKALKLLKRLGRWDCIKESIINSEVEKALKKSKVLKNNIDKICKISWSNPNLYVNNKEVKSDSYIRKTR